MSDLDVIYCPDYDRYFNGEEEIDAWVDDMKFDIKDWTLGDTKFFKCRKRYLHQSLCLATSADEYFSEQFENHPGIGDGAFRELETFYVEWCQRHDLSWHEPTKEEYAYQETARELAAPETKEEGGE